MTEPSPHTDLAEVYRGQQRQLFGVCYRMTGSASDAEDLVQETFARALGSPPRDTERDWRPWLMRVAVNLSIDHLRRRQREPYVGPWLPEPTPTGDTAPEPSHEPRTSEGRYELLESCSFAFLVALEALSPTQRAVLLLRDVFEYTGDETARALDLSAANARQLLRRARQAMARYDAVRMPIRAELQERTRERLLELTRGLATGDVQSIEQLLTDEVVALNDGGGRYFAARKPIVGRSKVARFAARLPAYYDEAPDLRLLELNGLPAQVGRYASPTSGHAPAFAHLIQLHPSGLLRAAYTIVAPRKLERVLGRAFDQAPRLVPE